MDSHRSYLSHHRQSLRPGSGVTMTSSMLASRYGLGSSSSSSSSSTSKRSGSCGASPIRSRSNSTSRFKAAAAVAVAAATGHHKHSTSGSSSSHLHHRMSVAAPFSNVLSSASGGAQSVISGLGAGTSSLIGGSGLGSTGTNSSASSTASNTSSTGGGSSATGGSTAAGISSTVVSFMKKFVNKASPNNNSSDSIDLSFEQYQKQLQQQRQSIANNHHSSSSNAAISSASVPATTTTISSTTNQSPTKYLFSTITGGGGGQTSDTGYSSNAGSPVTTPPKSSIFNTTSTSTAVSSSGGGPASSYSPTGSLGSLVSSTIYPPGLADGQSRPSSAASAGGLNNNSSATGNIGTRSSTAASSTATGPLLSKIRAKVASTFQQQQQANGSAVQSPIADGQQFGTATNLEIGKSSRSCSITSTTSNATGTVGTPTTSTGYQRAPMLSMLPSGSQSSSLTNEQLTAHLTDEERQILQKVWQKEEEFQQIALKNFSKNMATGDMLDDGPSIVVGTINPAQCSSIGPAIAIAPVACNPTTTSTAGAAAAGDVSHLSTNLLDPVAAAVHRRRSSAIMSADATGFCRICRKVIMKNEQSHRCSNCQELVCDDCSSYSSREESKYWMCSFCRRRGSHLVLVTTANSTDQPVLSGFLTAMASSKSTTTTTSSTTSGNNRPPPLLSIPNGTSANGSISGPTSPNNNSQQQQQQQFLTATSPNALNTKRKLSFQDQFQRPRSAMEQYQQSQQNRQSSLDLQKPRKTSLATGSSSTMATTCSTVQLSGQQNFTQTQQQQPQLITSLPTASGTVSGTLATPSIEPRPRIYSLSDDEELWNNNKGGDEDDDDGDDRDGDDDDDLEDEDFDDDHQRRQPEINVEVFDSVDQQQQQQPLFAQMPKRTRSLSTTRQTQQFNTAQAMLGQPQQAQQCNNQMMIMQPTQTQPTVNVYGTLQAVPPEMIKQQRFAQQKKKKKKLLHNSHHLHHGTAQYNSDDELLHQMASNQEPIIETTVTGSTIYSPAAVVSVPNNNTPPITITSMVDTNPVDQLTIQSTTTVQPIDTGQNFNSSIQPVVDGVGVSYQQCQNQQPKLPPTPMTTAGIPPVMPKIISVTGTGSSVGKPSGVPITAAHWWRLTNKARSLCRANGGPDAFYATRKQLSSESSDFSDGFNRYSPPQDSLTPSSEYSRSPRESADSDMLGLNCYNQLAAQCRAIPSVMVGVDDGNSGNGTGVYLSTKDCYLRRGSTGRALPKIPVVGGGSSMLDLPHSRKSSQHSLDIPADQPRRASAPESGDPIRIVIDECGDLSASHIELTSTTPSTSTINNEVNSMACTSGGGQSHNYHHHAPTIQVSSINHQTPTLQQRMRYQLSRAASITTHYERIVLHCDKTDHSTRTRGFSLAITGGKLSEMDGMLYAYVTWIKPGGQADRQSMKAGDKILEWNGKSLVNCSHEQVCNIMDTSGDTVELIVESMVRNDGSQQSKRRHSLAGQNQNQSTTTLPSSNLDGPTSTTNTTTSAPPSGRPSSAAAVISTTTTNSGNPSTNGGPNSIVMPSINQASVGVGGQHPSLQSGASLRRRLPQIPGVINTGQPSSSSSMLVTSNLLSDAQIFLQVNIDANIRQLSVMIIQAKGLDRHPIYVHNPGLEAYAQLRLLPEMGFKICQTELSQTFDWNETLIYHQFPLERIEKITLDLSIWATTPATYIPGGGKPPRITITGGSTSPAPPTIDHQLASTRIPLRSALLLHISEWWPLIPCNTDPSIPLLLSQQQMASHSSQQSLVTDSGPPSSTLFSSATTTPGISSTSAAMTPTVFFQKAPSMDHIGDSNGGLTITNQMMMMMTSHSTPGSRRNSNRSIDGQNETGIPPQSSGIMSMMGAPTQSHSARSSPGNSRMKTSPTPPPAGSSSWFQRYRSSPSRASAASTLSSSTGRHSLDESYSASNASPRSGSVCAVQPRFTSLRLAQNRHSIGNLYQIPSNGRRSGTASPGGDSKLGHHLSAVDPHRQLALRRKSSSALVQDRLEYGSRNKLSVPIGGVGYQQMAGSQADSYQYLLEQNIPKSPDYQNGSRNSNQQTSKSNQANNAEMTGYQSDQESDLDDTSDDDEDFDNLLKDSNYTLDSLENKTTNTNQQLLLVQQQNSRFQSTNQSDLQNEQQNSTPASGKISQDSTGNKNLLGIDVHGSRYSISTDPRTPSQEFDDDSRSQDNGQGSGLTIPYCQERRPSFLRRLVPTAAETVMNMVMGGPGANAQPSDEILNQNNVPIQDNNQKRKQIKVVGEIKLGFIMTKGFLEIEVIAARGLPDSSFGPHAPDTYVKTYLIDRGRQIYKRKTRLMPSDKDPQYRQTLKYDASIIYGRTLLVSVWEKQRRRRTFDANSPIGSVEINVNQLQLHKLTIRWFKLRSFVNQLQTNQNDQSANPRMSTDSNASSNDGRIPLLMTMQDLQHEDDQLDDQTTLKVPICNAEQFGTDE